MLCRLVTCLPRFSEMLIPPKRPEIITSLRPPTLESSVLFCARGLGLKCGTNLPVSRKDPECTS